MPLTSSIAVSGTFSIFLADGIVNNKDRGEQSRISFIPFTPTDGPPLATAANAYSICTSFPEGLKQKWIQNNYWAKF